MSHWSKGKVTLEQGFDNGRIVSRPSSVNLGRIESSWGKGLLERWVLGWWSHQMRFMKGSSRKKREISSNGVTRQAMGEGFGNNLPSVIRDQKRIQNPPW
jgi:hypothetical protein